LIKKIGYNKLLFIDFLLLIIALLDYYKVLYFPTINGSTVTKNFSISSTIFLYYFIFYILYFLYNLYKSNYFKLYNVLLLIVLSIILLLKFFIICLFMKLLIDLYYFKFDVDNSFNSFFIIYSIFGFISILFMLFKFSTSQIFNYYLLLYNLFYISSYFTPLTVMVFLFFWLIKYPFNIKFNYSIFIKNFNIPHSNILFYISLFLNPFILIYLLFNYGYDIDKIPFGVDIVWYNRWMDEIISQNYGFFDVADGSRPVTLIIIYFIQYITNIDYYIINKIILYFINIILIYSIYKLYYQLFNNKDLSILISYFSSTGIITTVGLFSYFLTNNLTIIFFNFSLFYLFRVKKIYSKNFLFSIIFGLLVIFNHPWSFIHFYYSLFVILIFYFKYFSNNTIQKIETKYHLYYVIILMIIDLLKKIILNTYSGLNSINSLYIHHSTIDLFWNYMIFKFRYLYGGLMNQPLIYIFSFIGIMFLSTNNKIYNFYASNLVLLSSIIYVFSDSMIKSRLIYNLPLSFFTVMGIIVVRAYFDFKNYFYYFLYIHQLVYVTICIVSLI